MVSRANFLGFQRAEMTKHTPSRIGLVDVDRSSGRTRELFDGAAVKYGRVTNILRVFAHAPAALEAYLRFDDALTGGCFNASLREQIALTVAEANLCSYCLSVHAAAGAHAGLDAKDIAAARQAHASEARSDAVLKLARSIIVARGEIADADVAQARAAGLTDGEIVETVASVALNMFLNYMNHVALPPLDFPEVKPGFGYELLPISTPENVNPFPAVRNAG